MNKTEEKTEKVDVKKLTVFGRELVYNRCSCINVRIQSVEFPNLLIQEVMKDEKNDNIVSLTEMKVMEAYNKATEIKVVVEEKILVINTRDYVYFVQFNKEIK